MDERGVAVVPEKRWKQSSPIILLSGWATSAQFCHDGNWNMTQHSDSSVPSVTLPCIIKKKKKD